MHRRTALAALFALLLTAPALTQGSGPKDATLAPRSEPISDLTQLSEQARQMRQRILEAAKTGDLEKVAAVMQQNEMMPVFSFGGDRDPVAFWTESYPDSEGIEALAILIEILEMPFVHLDKGTPQEMFVWPYFYALPLKSLTPEQKVELFRLVTGADWREMLDFGAYIFFRVGISPDGVWHFFVAGD